MSTPADDPFAWVGATVDGKYRVDAVVGHGGFGVVYLAHHLGFKEKVALKCLKLPKELQGAERDRFEETLVHEGRLLLQLSRATTGVVQALDVGTAVSPNKTWTPYLLMEWLEGVPLDRELALRRETGDGGRSLAEALDLLDGAVRALAVAHDLGIAHRDIKPANLFLTQVAGRPAVKVLDFGIAKVIADSESMTRAFEQTGGTLQAFTARYGAPEQFSRRFGATGPWTDVFALALVFIEVVMGNPALDGSDAAQLFVASADKEVRPTLRLQGLDAGDEVEAVLKVALAVEPRDRYPTAAAFWEALNGVLRSHPERLALRPTPIDDSRPTRELSAHAATSPFGAAGASASGAPVTSASGPATELSSSSPISVSAPATGAPSPTRRSPGLKLALVAATAAAAAGLGGAGFWLSRPPKAAPGSDVGLPSAANSVGGAEPAPAPSTARDEADLRPALPLSSAAARAGSPWPGAQFRQIGAGTIEGRNLWLDGFRIVRRGDAGGGSRAAFAACGEIGLALCTEPEWELACASFAELGSEAVLTDSLEEGRAVKRGGRDCRARAVANQSEMSSLAGLCCERSIGMTTKNMQRPFLASTAGIVKKLENALNQHDAAGFGALLDDQVVLDGVARTKEAVVALITRNFLASPDLVVIHETCDVSVQANKVVKRSRRGRKVTSYETNTWTATCGQVRHQHGEAIGSTIEYVFSPASKLRVIGSPTAGAGASSSSRAAD